MLVLAAVLTLQDHVNESLMPSGHFLDPVGKQAIIGARPVDLVMSSDGQFVIVKHNKGITVLRASDWTVAYEKSFATGASMHGLVCLPSGVVYDSDAKSSVHVGRLGADGTIEWKPDIAIPKPKIGGDAYPCGIAALPGDRIAVCASRSNALVVLGADGSASSVNIDPCPYGVAVTADGKTAWVSCWGRRPGRKSAKSSGTDVEVDERGVATGGKVDVVDLESKRVVVSLDAGLQPSQIVIGGRRAYVANANSDTVGVYDLARRRQIGEVVVKPDLKLPFGSEPNALAVSEATNELLVACGGNNAVAVLTLADVPIVKGFIPTCWYPGSLAVAGSKLYVGSIKGIGSRSGDSGRHRVYDYSGSIAQLDLPAPSALAPMTSRVTELSMAPKVLQNMNRISLVSGTRTPVPAQLGEPSSIRHVVYVVKENRTYDQILGDIGEGNSDSSLTIYGADTTPNEHALAKEFVLLDNFYCSGVNSADGHSWVTEGIASSYLERSFGGWTRSYPFGGDDALNSASSGFIWDAVLGAGHSFRNYGEGDYAGLTTKMGWKQAYDATIAGRSLGLKQNIANERLRRYSCPEYPGWNLGIPDQYRANVFLRELKEFEKKSSMPDFSIVYLEQDHTAGLNAGMPTPKAMVADNDLALGRIIEGISHSKFWSSTAIFVVEDDAQDGFDHVDGHRSPCFVVSPYARRGLVVSNFYNQTSVVHTMLQILGVPPLNQMDAASPLMSDCFSQTPDLAPFTAKPAAIALDMLNVPKLATARQRKLMAQSRHLDFSKPDAADEDLLNRLQWAAAKGAKPYPRSANRRSDD